MDHVRPSNALATSFWLAIAGLSFIAYPALRPWGPESGAEGALDLGSTAWAVSHSLGMLGFVSLALALRSAAASASTAREWQWTGRPVREAETRAWLAAALLLPYFGAEAYGLQAVARHANEHEEYAVLDIADTFRFAALPMTLFALGLLILILVGVRLAIGTWRSGSLGRVGGLLAGLGLSTYLPQFFGSPTVQVTHGIILGLGLLLLAATVGRRAA